MININYYREANLCGNPWKDALFTSDSQLTGLRSRDLVTFRGQPILQQHHATYLTGKDTCRAHHFAKMLATAILKGQYPDAPGVSITCGDPKPTVLWIDTVRGPHACAELFREMVSGLDPDERRFHLLCLDVIGGDRDNFWEVTRRIEFYIKEIKPTLVVIDDIDNLMPYSGVTVATEFCRVIRDTINHTETSFLFIGYNHLNKRASSTGHLGKQLFPMASHVFSLTTAHDVTHVRLVNSLDLSHARQDDFHFTVGGDNLPHEVVKAIQQGQQQPERDYVGQNTLRDIMGQVIPEGQALTPDDLTARVASRRAALNRIDRSRSLIAQAAWLGIIEKDDSGNYSLNSPNPLSHSDIQCEINNSLTLPPHTSDSSRITGCQPVTPQEQPPHQAPATPVN